MIKKLSTHEALGVLTSGGCICHDTSYYYKIEGTRVKKFWKDDNEEADTSFTGVEFLYVLFNISNAFNWYEHQPIAQFNVYFYVHPDTKVVAIRTYELTDPSPFKLAGTKTVTFDPNED